MGSLCSSCFKSSKDEEGEERDRLLQNPAEVPADRTSFNGNLAPSNTSLGHMAGGDVGGAYSGFYQRDQTYGSMTVDTASNGNKNESSAWNRTLDKMASNVIDVSTIEIPSNVIEQSEWVERQKVYSSKVASSKVPIILKNKRGVKNTVVNVAASSSPSNLTISSETINRLKSAADPIDQDDLALIREFSEKSLQAFKTGFVINIKEDLVVQFDP